MKNSIQKKSFAFEVKIVAIVITCLSSIVLTLLFPMSIVLFPILVAFGICLFFTCMYLIYILIKNITDILVVIMGTLNKHNLSGNTPAITNNNVIDGDFKQIEESAEPKPLMVFEQLVNVDSNKHLFESVRDYDLSYLNTPSYLRRSTKIIY